MTHRDTQQNPTQMNGTHHSVEWGVQIHSFANRMLSIRMSFYRMQQARNYASLYLPKARLYEHFEV